MEWRQNYVIILRQGSAIYNRRSLMALEMIYNDTVDSYVEMTPWFSPLLYQSSITSSPPPLWQDFSQFEDSFLPGPPRLIWSRLVRFPAFFFFALPLHNLIYLDTGERNLWLLLLNLLIPILERAFQEKRTSNVTSFSYKGSQGSSEKLEVI